MKLRMALEEDQFHLRMKDASKRYQFRMNDATKIEVIGATTVHIVTVTDDSSPAVIDTEFATMNTWLTNGDTVILYDPFMEIYAVMMNSVTGEIIGDGVSMNSFVMRRYASQSGDGTTITITTNGPMTPEEIIAAVTLGWNI